MSGYEDKKSARSNNIALTKTRPITWMPPAANPSGALGANGGSSVVREPVRDTRLYGIRSYRIFAAVNAVCDQSVHSIPAGGSEIFSPGWHTHSPRHFQEGMARAGDRLEFVADSDWTAGCDDLYHVRWRDTDDWLRSAASVPPLPHRPLSNSDSRDG
ncbi:MAG: hypothetical protein R3C53_14975 [Pirellulaceae bacterium]